MLKAATRAAELLTCLFDAKRVSTEHDEFSFAIKNVHTRATSYFIFFIDTVHHTLRSMFLYMPGMGGSNLGYLPSTAATFNFDFLVMYILRNKLPGYITKIPKCHNYCNDDNPRCIEKNPHHTKANLGTSKRRHRHHRHTTKTLVELLKYQRRPQRHLRLHPEQNILGLAILRRGRRFLPAP